MSQRAKGSFTRPGRVLASSVTGATMLVGVFTLLVAACGGGGAKVAATAGQPAASTAAVTVVEISNPKLGSILADSKGRVLYVYTADKPGKIGCTGSCLKYWPPLLLASGAHEAVAGPGVSGLGAVTRPEGVQVTYHDDPLYTYVGDTNQNPIAGEDVIDNGGKWIAVVISPAAPITAKPASTTPKTVVTTPPPTASPLTEPPVANPPPAVPLTTPAPTTPGTTPPLSMPRATLPPTPATPPPRSTPPATPPPTTPHTTVPPTPPPSPPRTTPPTAPPTTVPPGGPSY